MVQDQPGYPPTASTGVVAKEEEEEIGGWKGQEDLADAKDLEDMGEVVRIHSSSEHHTAPTVLPNDMPLQAP